MTPTPNFLLSFLVTLPSCLTPGRLSKLLKDIHIIKTRETINQYQTGPNTFTIQYLGAGRLYLLNNKEGVLIDPSFSNQKVGKLAKSVLFDKENIHANKKMVTYGLKSIETQTGPLAPQVKATFSAHSHYQPRYSPDSTPLVWLHWEDFFRSYKRPPKTVRANNVPAFFLN
jgi:hypothetical protein